jgi:hypothetical protein
MYIYMYMYLYKYLYVYLYTYIHRDRLKAATARRQADIEGWEGIKDVEGMKRHWFSLLMLFSLEHLQAPLYSDLYTVTVSSKYQQTRPLTFETVWQEGKKRKKSVNQAL